MANRTTDKPAKSDWDVKEDIQKALLGHISDELKVAERNNAKINDDFETYYNMIHAIREEKPNEWESDIYLPEFLSRLLAQMGIFAGQYFSSTDYVETDIDSDDPKDVAEAKASKKLLNTLLKDKEAYYYQKIMRLKMFQNSCGYGIIKGGYKQRVEPVVSHYVQESDFSRDPETGDYVAEDGTPYLDPTLQKPAFDTVQKPVYKNNVLVDKPIFDVYPVQNVYMSPEYAYSLNDKRFVIFESEDKTLDDLRAEAAEMGYVNLDLLDEEDPEGPLGVKTYNRDGDIEEQAKPVAKTFIVYERWGKYPTITDKEGKYKPGIDKDGEWSDKAENVECIIYYAKNREPDDVRHIIGFRSSPHTKRPMVRFLCYVDPVNDNGFGDGEMTRELQRAINDNYNLMNYRTKLSITPAFKGKKFSGIPEKVTISPETVTMMENLDDLQEIKIEDNIQGGVIHQNLLSSRMDYSMATSPQTMGMPSERAETATVGAITNQRANLRSGMKSMNDEFIGFTEFYDMLLTLVNDFMLPETLEELLGPDAFAYNPKRKDKFKPVSQALETEESKQFKLKTWQGILQMVVGMPPNPKTPMVVNYAIGQMLELMGGQFSHFKKFMFEDNPEAVALYQIATGAQGGQGTPPTGPSMTITSNQQGIPQAGAEQMTRMMAPGQRGPQ
jgi:hypothetical protein